MIQQPTSVYVTTGNNYTSPPTATSDAFVALKGRDGKIVWTHQCVSNDTGTIDADIGDSPQIYTLSSGEKVVGAGERTASIGCSTGLAASWWVP